METRTVAALAIAALWSSQSLAQSASPLSNTELSKETENPVTRLMTLPLRYQADFLDGADKLTKSTFELDQAVVPFRLIGPRPRYSCHGEFGSARSSCTTCSDVISVRFLVNVARRAPATVLRRLAHMERERGKSQTDMPVRANHHQHAAQFATAVSN